MKKTKIVFFDIDHTIYDPYQKSIPQSTIEAFKKLSARQDILIGIATGRALYMLDIIKELIPYIDVYITINGQIVATKDEIIHDEPLSKSTIRDVKTVFNHHKLTFGYIGKTTQAINKLDEETIQMFHEASIPLPDVDPNYENHHAVYQMWAFADDAMFETMKEELPDYQLVSWLSDGFDVVLDSRSKKDGIIKILAHYNIPLKNSYCFGDGDNDIEMLELIPHSFAMGNAKHAVRQSAKHTTEAIHEDGVYHALKRIGLIE